MTKKYSVDITATAESDVAEIWEYIAQDKPEAATAFVLRIEKQISTLQNFPERCQLVTENELLGTTYRHLVYGNYRTIFRIAGKRVILLRVLHGTQLLDIGLLAGLESSK